MTKSALAKLAILGVISATACSLFVDADRSTVKDDLYQPSVFPPDDAGDAGDAESGDDAGEGEGTAAGAGGAAGADGDTAAAAGTAGASAEGGSGG